MQHCQKLINSFDLFAVLPPSRFDVAASGGVGPCFGEPPLPSLPLPGGDDELFSPTGNGDMSPTCCPDASPTFEKPMFREMEKTIEGSRFIAQHVRNKDKFESVSTKIIYFLRYLIILQRIEIIRKSLKREKIANDLLQASETEQ